MELRCELSPLVYAVLYQKLAADTNRHRRDLIEERLNDIGWEADWLGEAATAYEAKWQEQIKDAASLSGLPTDHAELATWLLAALRSTGPSSDFGSELRAAVNERALHEITPSPAEVPPHCRPELAGWTLGMVIGGIDWGLPLILAVPVEDPNVQAAYEGLVEYVLHLEHVAEPWPEMVGSATLWRGSGLAEALKPGERAASAIEGLLNEARKAFPDHQRRDLQRHFQDFIEARNALTHVIDNPRRRNFVHFKDKARGWESHAQRTVLGVTNFVGLQVSEEMLNSARGTAWARKWTNEMEWDLKIYNA